MGSPFQQAQRCAAVAPSDTVALPGGPAESLWIGVGGTVSFVPFDPTIPGNLGATISTTVPAGLFPVKCMRVNATGTAATGIVAFY